jgi:hypothetical protein
MKLKTDIYLTLHFNNKYWVYEKINKLKGEQIEINDMLMDVLIIRKR